MGTVAVLADIHGNLAALEAVLTALKPIKPRAYWVLGDVFGELGQARAVLDRLRELNAFCLMGNRERDMAAYIRGEKPEWQGAMQFAALILFYISFLSNIYHRIAPSLSFIQYTRFENPFTVCSAAEI